jgi:hypothetical protein
LVTAPAVKADEFAEQMHQLGNKYQQEAIIVKSPDGAVRLKFSNGETQEIGQFNANRVAQAYTSLRGKKGTFVFEAEREDLGWIARLAGLKKLLTSVSPVLLSIVRHRSDVMTQVLDVMGVVFAIVQQADGSWKVSKDQKILGIFASFSQAQAAVFTA